MAKTLSTIVAAFWFAQIVCTSPMLRLKRDDDLLTERDRRMIFYTTIFTLPELLASANATHDTRSFLPTDQSADKRNHVISKSLMEVWMNLRTMEAAQSVVNKTITKFATTTIESLKSADGGPINMYFEVLDKALVQDDVTGTPYEEAKNNYERLVNLEPDHLEKEKNVTDNDHFLRNEKNLQISIYYLNYLFGAILHTFNLSEATAMNDLSTNDTINLEFYLTGRALIQTSENTFFCRYKTLQNIYEECLTQVARKSIRGEFKENIGQEIKKLLPKLINEKINADPPLKAEFDQQKKILWKKLDAVRLDAEYPPHIWAQFSASINRTTNTCESFHSKLNNDFYSAHPNIYIFVDVLLGIQCETYIKSRSMAVRKSKTRDEKIMFIEQTMARYSRKEITSLQFVHELSFKFLPPKL